MFTRYELLAIRDAIIDSRISWQERIDRGADVSERFMVGLESIETKLDEMVFGDINKFTHRHVKRGTLYRWHATGRMQASTPVSDMDQVEIYQGEDGQWWVRPTAEFNDGRFEEV